MTPLPDLAAALAGRYRVDREVGAGGMATVYLAHDVRHSRDVAIKVFRRELAQSMGTERFLREIQIAAQLHHPHILTLHDSGEAAGYLYYLMPYVDGDTLRARLRTQGALPVAEALLIAREVADALRYAHGRDVVHRDIKPENILLADGHAFVADFGIARALNHATEALTQTGFALGTPAYMAPEQALGEKDIDGRADVYALGCVMFEMLIGRPPYSVATHQAALVRRFTDPVPSVRAMRSDLPETVDNLIRQMLDPDPARRPSDLGVLIEGRDDSGASVSQRTAAEASTPSVLVLPFANLSPDPDTDYFADGLTEELIADLSNVVALRVIARNSAMRLKGTSKDARTLGRELNVTYVLAGSVRRAGTQLRITAQLAHAPSDHQLWAGKFAGTVEETFELQERLSGEIVRALSVQLSPADRNRLAAKPRHELAVFECYQRARHAIYQFTAEANERAIDLVRQGLVELGEHELLLTAHGHASLNRLIFGAPEADALSAAQASIDTIRRRWPTSTGADLLQGVIEYRRGRAAECVAACSRALLSHPTDVEVLMYLAIGYFQGSWFEEARKHASTAADLDPLNPIAWNVLGVTYLYDARVQEAMAFIRRGAGMETESALCRACLVVSLVMTGENEELGSIMTSLERSHPTDPFSCLARSLGSAMAGDSFAARALLPPEVRAASHGDEMMCHYAAGAFAALGDTETALEYLEHMVRVRGFGPSDFFAHHDALTAALRQEPRFQSLLGEMRAREAAFARALESSLG